MNFVRLWRKRSSSARCKQPLTDTLIVVLLVVAIVVLLFSNSVSAEHGKRCKRRVLFTKSSKMFIRINGKENVIPWTTVFSHGWGFRVNWDLPTSLPRRHILFRRELKEDIEDYLNYPGMEGFACVLKYICNMVDSVKTRDTCGIFCEIGNIITRAQGWDAHFLRSYLDKCDQYSALCPMEIKPAKTSMEY